MSLCSYKRRRRWLSTGGLDLGELDIFGARTSLVRLRSPLPVHAYICIVILASFICLVLGSMLLCVVQCATRGHCRVPATLVAR